MSCTCASGPDHELWCDEAFQGLTVDEARTYLNSAPVDGGKRFVVDLGDGRYVPVEQLAVEFHRGVFVVVAKAVR